MRVRFHPGVANYRRPHYPWVTLLVPAGRRLWSRQNQPPPLRAGLPVVLFPVGCSVSRVPAFGGSWVSAGFGVWPRYNRCCYQWVSVGPPVVRRTLARVGGAGCRFGKTPQFNYSHKFAFFASPTYRRRRAGTTLSWAELHAIVFVGTSQRF